MTTGELCKKLREDVGLSQRELATAMGVSAYVIGTAESGKAYGKRKNAAISKETATKYKEYFGVDILNSEESKTDIQNDLEVSDTMSGFREAADKINKEFLYTVDKFGSVDAICPSELELLKKREEENNAYICSLEEERCNLKAELESEKAHAAFYEEKFREAQTYEDKYYKATKQIDEYNEQLTDMEYQYDILKQEYEDYKKDFNETLPLISECKDILLALLIERYREEIATKLSPIFKNPTNKPI